MTNSEELLHRLVPRFQASASERLDEMSRVLAQIAQRPEDLMLLEQLARHFHNLAGAGSLYSYPVISEAGFAGERSCSRALKNRRAGTAEIQLWHDLVSTVRAALTDEPASTARKERHSNGRATVSVLIVDRSEVTSYELSRLFEAHDAITRVAHSAKEAIEQLDLEIPEVLIAEVALDDGDGFDIVRNLRSRNEGHRSIALMIDSTDSFVHRIEATRCGADAFFARPVDPKAILDRAQILLQSIREAPRRVLLVEDDPSQADYIRTLLETGGFEVHYCRNADEFETSLSRFQPDLVLVDIDLDGRVDGFELAGYLRQDDRYMLTPIVFLSAGDDLDDRIHTARRGADDFISKSASTALLLSVVSARIERSRYLHSMLHRDGLTGLLTHSAFVEAASRSFEKIRRNPVATSALVMLDLDHFKQVNDTFGHPTGDKVLTSLSAFLRQRLRKSDVLGRYGGEEFSLVIDDLQREDAYRLMQRMLRDFQAVDHVSPSGSTFQCSFSAGVAHASTLPKNLDNWIARADDALYDAKRAGRARVRVAE